jgi:hypothetical protein
MKGSISAGRRTPAWGLTDLPRRAVYFNVMRLSKRSISYMLLTLLWAGAVALGTTHLWKYKASEGIPAQPSSGWPSETQLVRPQGQLTLVLLVHPRCPCSRATLGELATLMSTCDGRLNATVLMLRPAGMPDGWERTDLWTTAAAIPGVRVVTDLAGSESRRFGAATSGQALLYAADGRLLFAGGITESRGHQGDNAGRSAIASLVLGDAANGMTQTPVFGCPLFGDRDANPNDGSPTCPN